jgi:hypothetical protein
VTRAGVLARGQQAAEAGMVDACTIRRATGGGTTDPVTGYPTQAYSTVYTGKCRVQQRAAVARPREAGEDQLMIVRFELHLPVAGTSDLRVNDEVTLTASAHDPDLLGRMFLVIELAHKSEATARRVGVTERTGS